MDLSLKLLSIFALIVAAAYFAISEISLAGSRRVRLTQMVENGDKRAQEVINLQEKPGPFFSVIQIGINAVAFSAVSSVRPLSRMCLPVCSSGLFLLNT